MIDAVVNMYNQGLRQEDVAQYCRVARNKGLSDLWEFLPSAYFEKPVASMNSRLITVGKFKGISIKY